MAAAYVIGQPDLTSNAGNNAFASCSSDTVGDTNPCGLLQPNGLAIGPSGGLWVADTNNQRALEFSTPISDGEAASSVVGQPDFVSNSQATSQTGLSYFFGLGFDSSGNLWIPDYGNNRVS